MNEKNSHYYIYLLLIFLILKFLLSVKNFDRRIICHLSIILDEQSFNDISVIDSITYKLKGNPKQSLPKK